MVRKLTAARWWVWLLGLGICLSTGVARAQGVLLDERDDQHFRLPRPIWPHPPVPVPPRPEQSYRLKELDIHVGLRDQIAKVQVTQSFENTGSRPLEVCFVFPLPYEGAIDQMTFLVDGREYPAKLMSAAEARRIYEGHVRRNQDPALLEWVGTGLFKTNVFPVPPGASRQVTLKYSQVCRKQGGLTEFLYPLATAKYTSLPVEKLRLNVAIDSQAKIKNVYSPSHALEVKRSSDHQISASYSGANEIPTADFQLLYDVGDQAVGANLLSYRPKDGEDGYFLLLVSPEIRRTQEKPLAKSVVFVVDRSGSMSGKKIEQAKGALRFVLNNLREGDLFNIVAYDSGVESFRPELQRFQDDTRQAALGFVEGIYAGGSTNISGALEVALGQLADASRANYVVFLTDGLPTVGERNELRIVEASRKKNQVRARIFCFGVGFDVNSRLLDKLARTGFGQSQYVRPNEDIEARVSQLYSRIGAPALKDVEIALEMDGWVAEKGALANRIYPRDAYDLFAGDQLVLVGRYKQGGAGKLTVRGTVDGTKHEFHFPAPLVEKSNDDSLAFVEKLWAIRRVGEIIDEIDLQGKNQELVDELVALATKHGIVTPYTSFLADENANVHDLAGNAAQATERFRQLEKTDGYSGFVQRDIKARFQYAPNAAAAAPATRMSLAESATDAAGLGRTASAGSGGFGGGTPGPASPAANAPAGDSSRLKAVRQIGAKTFYFRQQRWIDSAITAEQEKQVKQVAKYSDAYFDLLAKFGAQLGKYLATDDPVTVVLDGQAYEF